MSSSKEKIQTRAAYEAACTKFVESFLNSGEPDYFINALTDTVLVYAQTNDVRPRIIDANHVLIMNLRELSPIYDFYENH